MNRKTSRWGEWGGIKNVKSHIIKYVCMCDVCSLLICLLLGYFKCTFCCKDTHSVNRSTEIEKREEEGGWISGSVS